MFSFTRTRLEQFDNQHDFERMAADILNATGCTEVVLIAPRGGSDGGKDITFTTRDGKKGLACVTLREDIEKKFKEDFTQRIVGEYEQYAFFCTAYLTAKQKSTFEDFCDHSLQAKLLLYDIEALRSLLDNDLNAIRYRYLGIDDEKSEKKIAKSVITFLEDRRVLYNPLSFEVEDDCVYSVKEIRKYLTEKMNDLDQSCELTEHLRTMRLACRKFLNSDMVQILEQHSSFSYRNFDSRSFYISLGEMRGTFGICLSRILFLYKLDIEEDLAKILPDSDK